MRGMMVSAVFLLAACSSGDKAGSDGKDRGGLVVTPEEMKGHERTAGAKACDAIDKASVDAAMGRDMGQPSTSIDTMCQYLWSGERPSEQAMATLTIHDTTLDALEPGLKDMKAEMSPVSGIGDRAFWAKGYGLYVQHNGRSGIYVAAQGLGDDEEAQNIAKTEALAKATVGKL